MDSPFILKLRHGAQLTFADEQELLRLTQTTTTTGPRRDVLREGGESRSIPLITEGWACRYSLRSDGRRQITAFYLPGDLCEPFGAHPHFLDCAIGALSSVSVAHIAPAALRSALRSSPRIEDALWWDLLVATSIDQERLVSIGRRSSLERLAHFFCELYVRLGLVGMAANYSCEVRMTQTDLSDLLGLTPVHVNRSLRHLRQAGLISLNGQQLTIHDFDELQELADFDPSYLHLSGTVRRDGPIRLETVSGQR